MAIFKNISKLITSHNTSPALQLSLLQKNNYCCAFLAAYPLIQLKFLLPGYTGLTHSAGQIELPPCPGTRHSLPFQTFVCLWEQPAPVCKHNGLILQWGRYRGGGGGIAVTVTAAQMQPAALWNTGMLEQILMEL